jgi:hypothetical protein
VSGHALEALQLEVRRAAARCGLDVNEIRIETVADRPSR